MFNHWLGLDVRELSIRSTYNLAYNAAFLVEQRLGLMLSFGGLVATDEAHHPELSGRCSRPCTLIITWEGRPDMALPASSMRVDVRELSIRSTYNLAYNAAFLVEQRLGLMLSFGGLVATDEAHHPELTFRPLQPALYSHNYLIWKEGQTFSRAAGVVHARLEEVFGTHE
ncbi:MAG: hypothetical protein ACFWTM_04610 [Mitsuokella multacida]